jgi:hypothetical protein
MSDVYVTFGGDSSELEASLASAKVAVQSLTRELADLAREQVAAGAGLDSDIGQQMIDLGGKLSDAKEHAQTLKRELAGVGKSEGGEEERAGMLERMSGSLKGMLAPVIEVKEHFAELIEVFAAAFAVEKIADWASETTEAMEQVESEGAKLGVSLEKVETLQGVAKLAGTDYSELAQQLERLQLSLSRVGERASPAGEALRVLGLNAASLRGQTLDAQIETIAQAFSHFGDGPNKTAAAIALLGRAGADMIPFLDKGREGIEELQQVTERTGVVMSGDLVEAMARTREHISEMSLAWQGLSEKIFAAVNPAIDAFVVSINRAVESITKADIRAFAESMIGLGASIRNGAVVGFERLNAVVQDFEAFSARVDIVMNGLVSRFQSLGDKINYAAQAWLGLINSEGFLGDAGPEDEAPPRAPARGRRVDGDAAYGKIDPGAFGRDMFDIIGENALKAGLAVSQARKETDEWAAKLKDALGEPGGLHDGKPAGGGEAAQKPQVPDLNLAGGGREAAQEASRQVRADYEAEVVAAQDAAQDQEKTLDGLLQRKVITSDIWLDASLAALDTEQDAIQDAAEKALASAALTSSQKVELANREARELKQIAAKIEDDQNKAAEATQKQWDAAFNTINGAVDGQIDGLLRGTTSWAQAFKNVLATLTEDVIKFFVNWSLKAAERYAQDEIMQAASVSAHVTGNAVKAASDQSAAAAGGFAWVGQALKTLSADAASVFGGVFAFLAPVMGPAAAAPAAGASSAVLAAGGAIASADIGMWSVPGDQVAMIHKNELIMPAPEAGAFRSLLTTLSGGGGAGQGVSIAPTTHFHVNAIDGASVGQWFRGNGREMMKAVDDAVRHGAHLGLRRIAPA